MESLSALGGLNTVPTIELSFFFVVAVVAIRSGTEKRLKKSF